MMYAKERKYRFIDNVAITEVGAGLAPARGCFPNIQVTRG